MIITGGPGPEVPGTKAHMDKLKEKYTTTEEFQSYVEAIGDKYSEINIVAVLRNLNEFVENDLTDMERLVFQKYYFHSMSIHQIKWTEPIDTYAEVEKLLKSAKKKFESWAKKQR